MCGLCVLYGGCWQPSCPGHAPYYGENLHNGPRLLCLSSWCTHANAHTYSGKYCSRDAACKQFLSYLYLLTNIGFLGLGNHLKLLKERFSDKKINLKIPGETLFNSCSILEISFPTPPTTSSIVGY